MSIWLRLLLALAAAVGGGLVSFVVIVFVAARIGSCPATVQTCDLPAIAAFGLGFFLAPVLALVIGWFTFHRAGRRSAKPAAVVN
jgi:hypothetical protein